MSKSKLAPKQDYYVYMLVDPRDNKPFYVGKGKGRRCHEHVGEWRRSSSMVGRNRQKLRRIGEIIEAGLEVEVRKVAEGMTERGALDEEKRFILAARASLTNLKSGGGLSLLERFDRDLYDRLLTPKAWRRQYMERYLRIPTREQVLDYAFSCWRMRRCRRDLMEVLGV